MSGKLFIVASPIGNMEDITLRAIKVLKEVSVILSEDTRETQKILNHFEISKPQISYRDQNHLQVLNKIVDLIESGNDLAILSDRGTPLISDPGFKLVRDLISKGYEVVSIPGPSSVIASLVVSGLPTDKFTFLGFLPKTESQRVKIINNYGELDTTLIFFESPYRILKLLEEVKKTLGNRDVCVVKELTKLHEEVYRFNLSDLDTVKIDLRGEFVVLVSKEQ
jgi:16S rRNA (cytidine1402-2'-O)-methyltransferase